MRCAFSICSAWNVGKSERVKAFHEGSVNVRKRPGCARSREARTESRPSPTPPVRFTIVATFRRSMTSRRDVTGARRFMRSPYGSASEPHRRPAEMAVKIDRGKPRRGDFASREREACSEARTDRGEDLRGSGRKERRGARRRGRGGNRGACRSHFSTPWRLPPFEARRSTRFVTSGSSMSGGA